LDGNKPHPIRPQGCSYASIRNVDVQTALLKAKPGTAPSDLYKQGILDGKTPFTFSAVCKAWSRRP
jgi:hypothetical protein